MAVITPVVTNTVAADLSVNHISWSTLTEVNTSGTPISAVQFADRSVQVTGTFGATSVALQGSNELVPVTWVTLTDPKDKALTFTTAGLEQISERTLWIRPFLTGGTGVDLDVHLIAGLSNTLRT